MIENKKREITALDEAKIIIATLDNKVHLQELKLNSMAQENKAILQDNVVLYECLVRELAQKFSVDHIVELINCYKFNSQNKMIELQEADSRAKFFERQRDIYALAFKKANVEGATELLAEAEKEWEDKHL